MVKSPHPQSDPKTDAKTDPKTNPKTEPGAPAPLTPDAAHTDEAHMSVFARALAQFSVAWLFLTRVPLPAWWNRPLPDEQSDPPSLEVLEASVEATKDKAAKDKAIGLIPLADTVRTWGFVGLLVGAVAGLAVWVGAYFGLHPLASAFLGLMVAALMTGGLHEDGLADVADGFGGGDSKARKLAIMKDSHIGAFGVLALLFVIGFKAAALGGFNSPALAAGALMAAHVLSRAVMPLMMCQMKPARSNGLGHGAGVPNFDDAVVGAIIAVLLALLLLGIGPGLLAVGLAAVATVGVGWIAHRQIGGYTGDVLGTAQQIVEAVVLAGMAAAFQTVFYI